MVCINVSPFLKLQLYIGFNSKNSQKCGLKEMLYIFKLTVLKRDKERQKNVTGAG